ncbi:CKLF-like MARVEL transmembrane domain-containing protein 6 [Gastrophryne carolinensis]
MTEISGLANDILFFIPTPNQLGIEGQDWYAILFSFVAFICEEVIYQCETCWGLYVFEFVSCSAFFLTLIIIIVYVTKLQEKINLDSFRKIDFYITLLTGVVFFLASIIFIATIEKSELAQVSVAFGFLASFAFLAELFFMWRGNYLQRNEKQKQATTNGVPEGQPLNNPVQENTA